MMKMAFLNCSYFIAAVTPSLMTQNPEPLIRKTANHLLSNDFKDANGPDAAPK